MEVPPSKQMSHSEVGKVITLLQLLLEALVSIKTVLKHTFRTAHVHWLDKPEINAFLKIIFVCKKQHL